MQSIRLNPTSCWSWTLGAVVLVVVDDDPGVDVVVVVEVEVVVPDTAVNWTVTGNSGRFTPSVVSSAV